MKVVRGKQLADLDGSDVEMLLSGYERVVVDVGAGDGRFAYTYARDNPDAFVVAIDAVKENLREASHRAGRKPERGGTRNVLYVWASAEEPPAELVRCAGEVWVMLPWGRLLDGLVLGDDDVLDGLVALLIPGGMLRTVLNCEVWGANIPVKVSHLPELSPQYARDVLAERYSERGLDMTTARMLTQEETRALRSPWAKRLHSTRDRPRFLYLEAVRTGTSEVT